VNKKFARYPSDAELGVAIQNDGMAIRRLLLLKSRLPEQTGVFIITPGTIAV
jgi:hypothetical protein